MNLFQHFSLIAVGAALVIHLCLARVLNLDKPWKNLVLFFFLISCAYASRLYRTV